MADDYGPGGVYANIPRFDSRKRAQLPMFERWNPDPVGNDPNNLASLNPDLQRIVAQARADNPDLKFVIGSGKRSAEDQDLAKQWGWSQVGSKDGGDATTHMKGNAVDLWGLDSQGRVQFDPAQQQRINQAMQAAAQKLGVTGMTWGGDNKTFKDAPHFEMRDAAPAAPAAAQPAAAPTPGTTINSNAIIDTLMRNIAGIESGGWKNPYEAKGPVVGNRGQALGKYQVMPENIPGWTQAALGQAMTPAQFLASPDAQEKVMRDQMQRGLQLYGPKDVASIYFTGKPFNVAGGAVSDGSTRNDNYVARATAGLSDSGTFTPGPAVAASAKTPDAPAAPSPTVASGPPSGLVPGFTTKEGSDAFLKGTDALQKAMGGGGQGQGAPQGPSPMIQGPGAVGVSPLLAALPMTYGQTINSLTPALQAQVAGSAPSAGPPPYPGAGSPIGTSINSMQQLQAMLDQQGWGGFGGGYG